MATKKSLALTPNLEPMFFWEFRYENIDWKNSYKMVIERIIERGDQPEVDEIVRFYGYDKVINALKNEIHFLPNYAIDRAIAFFPELDKEEMHCYVNRKGKPYHWI